MPGTPQERLPGSESSRARAGVGGSEMWRHDKEAFAEHLLHTACL